VNLIEWEFSCFDLGKNAGSNPLKGLFNLTVVLGVDFDEDKTVLKCHLFALLVRDNSFLFEIVFVAD
jgi:hypothetical protein